MPNGNDAPNDWVQCPRTGICDCCLSFIAFAWLGLSNGNAMQQPIPTSHLPSWVQSCGVCLKGAILARISCYGNVTEKKCIIFKWEICVFFDKRMSCQHWCYCVHFLYVLCCLLGLHCHSHGFLFVGAICGLTSLVQIAFCNIMHDKLCNCLLDKCCSFFHYATFVFLL